MTTPSLRNFIAAAAAALALAACKPAPEPAAAPEQVAVAAPAEVAPAPATPVANDPGTAAQRYDGKLVRQPAGAGGKDDGWYLVKDGKRRWIVDSAWLGKNGYTPEQVIEISREEFAAIPEDPAAITE